MYVSLNFFAHAKFTNIRAQCKFVHNCRQSSPLRSSIRPSLWLAGPPFVRPVMCLCMRSPIYALSRLFVRSSVQPIDRASVRLLIFLTTRPCMRLLFASTSDCTSFPPLNSSSVRLAARSRDWQPFRLFVHPRERAFVHSPERTSVWPFVVLFVRPIVRSSVTSVHLTNRLFVFPSDDPSIPFIQSTNCSCTRIAYIGVCFTNLGSCGPRPLKWIGGRPCIRLRCFQKCLYEGFLACKPRWQDD